MWLMSIPILLLPQPSCGAGRRRNYNNLRTIYKPRAYLWMSKVSNISKRNCRKIRAHKACRVFLGEAHKFELQKCDKKSDDYIQFIRTSTDIDKTPVKFKKIEIKFEDGCVYNVTI